MLTPAEKQWALDTLTISLLDANAARAVVATADGNAEKESWIRGLMKAEAESVCEKCGMTPKPRKDCHDGWLDAIGPCRDGSYITSRACRHA